MDAMKSESRAALPFAGSGEHRLNFEQLIAAAVASDASMALLLIGALVIVLCFLQVAVGSGTEASIALVGFSALAVLVLPAHRRLHSTVDRLFFAERFRRAHALHTALRRYVPSAVVEHIESGQNLADGERDVSVLFVDIRGYTSFSEGVDATVLFSMVNRYVTDVSMIVRQLGGSVVEFSGDGMMAVFGAPIPLADKERAAVEAGRAIVEAAQSLIPAAKTSQPVPLSVGVGIATGTAFAGSIQAADHLIWSVIGNTTNLAARLEDLTRDLNAAIVIDARTRGAAGDCAAAFECQPQVAIRGRRDKEDLYVLRLP